METTADKLRAFGYSIAVHLAVIAVAALGVLWTHETKTVSLAGPIIEATLVGPAKTAPRPAPPRPKQPPKVEQPPKPQEEAKPETAPELPAQDKKNQEKVTDLAALQAAEAQKVQEEKRKKEQLLLEEQQKAKDAAEKKKKLEEEKQQQIKDKKLKDLAAQQKKLEAEYQAHLEEAEQATTGNEGEDTSLEAEYFAAIQKKIEDNWLRPEDTQPGLRCVLDIVQLPGGDVLSVRVSSPCNADPLTRDTLEQAVKRAVPLPYDEKYRPYFRRQIKLNFKYDG